jgi:anti-sigma B factor antagonist
MAFVDDPFSFEQLPGKAQGTLIFRLIGPFTLRNLFALQAQLRACDPPPLTILDFTAVPYMDSAGMGTVINHHIHCQRRGTRLIVAGVSDRIMELFKVTKVDSIISMAATVEEAEARG